MVCCANTHIQILKVWPKSVLLLLKLIIFRGLFLLVHSRSQQALMLKYIVWPTKWLLCTASYLWMMHHLLLFSSFKTTGKKAQIGHCWRWVALKHVTMIARKCSLI